MPSEWVVSLRIENKKKKLKRITFSEWAEDDTFYEKLLEGESVNVSNYQLNRQ